MIFLLLDVWFIFPVVVAVGISVSALFLFDFSSKPASPRQTPKGTGESSKSPAITSAHTAKSLNWERKDEKSPSEEDSPDSSSSESEETPADDWQPIEHSDALEDCEASGVPGAPEDAEAFELEQTIKRESQEAQKFLKQFEDNQDSPDYLLSLLQCYCRRLHEIPLNYPDERGRLMIYQGISHRFIEMDGLNKLKQANKGENSNIQTECEKILEIILPVIWQ